VLFTEPTFLFLLPPICSRVFLKRPHAGYANWLLLAASIIFTRRAAATSRG
jgi:hypothetical protein